MVLTVIYPFGEYVTGDKIKDEAEIARILDSENACNVVKSAQ